MPENIRSELSHTSYNKASWGKDNMGAWCTGTKPSPVFETLGWWFTIICSKALAAPHSPMAQKKVGGICYHAPSRSRPEHPHMVPQHICSILATSSQHSSSTHAPILPRSRGRGNKWCYLCMPAMYNQWGSCTWWILAGRTVWLGEKHGGRPQLRS